MVDPVTDPDAPGRAKETVIIASKPLSDDYGWELVEPNSLVLIGEDRRVHLERLPDWGFSASGHPAHLDDAVNQFYHIEASGHAAAEGASTIGEPGGRTLAHYTTAGEHKDFAQRSHPANRAPHSADEPHRDHGHTHAAPPATSAVTKEPRRNNAMPELPAVAVFSDGCGLCKDAVSIMRRAAGSNAARVEERRIDDVPKGVIAEFGIRATPSIVFNDMVGFVGVPNEEEAELLLKRAEIDRVILQYSIPKSDAVQGFASGRVPSEATAKALANSFTHSVLSFRCSWQPQSAILKTTIHACSSSTIFMRSMAI